MRRLNSKTSPPRLDAKGALKPCAANDFRCASCTVNPLTTPLRPAPPNSSFRQRRPLPLPLLRWRGAATDRAGRRGRRAYGARTTRAPNASLCVARCGRNSGALQASSASRRRFPRVWTDSESVRSLLTHLAGRARRRPAPEDPTPAQEDGTRRTDCRADCRATTTDTCKWLNQAESRLL